MAGPRYTIAQTRARVAALEICAEHLSQCIARDELEAKQFADVVQKLYNEATRLKLKAQETRSAKQLLQHTGGFTPNTKRVLPTTTAAGQG